MQVIILTISVLAFMVHFVAAQCWERIQNVPTTECLTGISFINDSIGWASGCSGFILHTTDGGATWTTQNSGTTSGLAAVIFVDNEYGWVSGGTGYPNESCVVRHTTDGGTTWMPQNVIAEHSSHDIFFVNRRVGWVFRNWGSLLHSLDSGETWSLQTTSVAVRLDAMDFADSTHGWASGQDGTIIHTTNGGLNWIQQASGTTNWIEDITCVDTQNVWAASSWSNTSMILHSTDGGETWVVQYSIGANFFESICFADLNNGWVVGLNGTILHTTNGGRTWISQNSHLTTGLYGVTFWDNRNGWIVGENGTILRYRCETADSVMEVSASTDWCDSVLITWRDVENDTLYRIFRDSLVVGSAPRDSTHYWDFPGSGIHRYQVAAANTAGLGPMSASVFGQLRRLLVIERLPDTLYSDTGIHLHLNHCSGVLVDSVFLSLGGTPASFLYAPPSIADTYFVNFPDTIRADHPNSHLKILTCRHERTDTLVTNSFFLKHNVSDVEFRDSRFPTNCFLDQNYPNPFNPVTTIHYYLDATAPISIRVCDLFGHTVATLVQETIPAGSYVIQWNAKYLPSGVYFLRMESSDYVQTRKIVLLK
jgi:photosystem II stability/assembly factor-like uncharacterized protein